MTITIDNVTAMFPISKENMPRISTQQQVPTYSSLLAFQDAIDENAMAIPSWQCPDLGHLALTMASTDDFTAANDDTPFVIPIQPTDPTLAFPTAITPVEPAQDPAEPVDPTQVPAAPVPAAPATPAVPLDHFTVLERQRLYVAQRDAFYTYKVTEKALRSLILNSVDDQYINYLKDPKTKYSKVAPRTILAALWKSYGRVEVSDLSANGKRMKVQWNPPTPISNLWKQLSDGRKFALAGNETISTTQLTRFAYDNIAATGLFNSDLAKWRRQKIQNWTAFRQFFNIASQDREKNTTTQENGYHSANSVKQVVQEEIAAMLDNFQVPEPEPVRQPLAPITESANAAITLADITTLITTLMANQNNKGNGNIVPSNESNHASQGTNSAGKGITYCYTHGITQNLQHNSKTCARKCEGHKDNATLHNKMGGSTNTMQARKPRN